MTKPKTPKIKPTNGWAVVDKNGILWASELQRWIAMEDIEHKNTSRLYERFALFTVVPVTIIRRKEKRK
jgi:hypothetical protein